MTPLQLFYLAQEARRNAHFARRTKLPWWRIYFKAEMRRAIRKWQAFAEAARAER